MNKNKQCKKRVGGSMNVKIVNLNKWYGEVHALKNINVIIQTGKFTSLLGPSGCGKTTLLKILAGLETPDQGDIYFDDQCVFSRDRNINVLPQKRQIGMVFQEFALWPHMNVFENIAFPLKAKKMHVEIERKVESILETVRLEGMSKRYPDQLSGGQQQRVAFARAVVANPKIVLFDEPLSALDAVLRDEMRFEISNMVKQMNLTGIYVTHDQIEAMSMSDQIIVMNKGNILQVGTPEDIYDRPVSKLVMDFVGKSNWFECGTKAIRPERLALYPTGPYKKVSGVVQSIAYLGDKYEMIVQIEKMGNWMSYHNKRCQLGDRIDLYFKHSDVIRFAD
ncbi:ABC transporter ATP-binding protein [Fusibacter sp. 3D3]|uniref:ABC transporter ATP-binding protein n=1 Tax=Fusibacter sp. 3D3 TaxID=1048380 RepID=UPI0008570C2A|nr:ABC transporter ATP-binding protein [Fusibacter sp. 3D3]GAU79236.1 Putrescine transport ATP-binding protein PotA [Fusibacter sp. 3D3]